MERQRIRAWAYTRDCGVSPGALMEQITQLKKEAARLTIEVVGASQDISTGMSMDRRGLSEALTAVKTGCANTLLVRDLERLGEDKYTLLHIMEILQNNGAVLLCTAENTYDSLRAAGISPILFQWSFATGLGLPWLEEEPCLEREESGG